jgi:hypothetical protein
MSQMFHSAPRFHISLPLLMIPGQAKRSVTSLSATNPPKVVPQIARLLPATGDVVYRFSLPSLVDTVHRHHLFTAMVLRCATATREVGIRREDAPAGKASFANEAGAVPLLVERLTRQISRIEKQIVPVRTVLLQRLIAPSQVRHWAERGAAEHANHPASWAASTFRVDEPRARQTVPAFNFQQITDEVVRQLDSRLVASRERFGKI